MRVEGETIFKVGTENTEFFREFTEDSEATSRSVPARSRAGGVARHHGRRFRATNPSVNSQKLQFASCLRGEIPPVAFTFQHSKYPWP